MKEVRVTTKQAAHELQIDVLTLRELMKKEKLPIGYAGYLEVMDTGQALTRFFQRDSTKANNLTLYPNMEDEFWLWVSSWALFITKPSDLNAQWTYWSRKQNLLNFAKKKKKSIGDEEMQLEFLWEELTGSYRGVLSKLKSAKSAQEASDIILTGYEKPKDQGEKAKATRGSYAAEYHEQFATATTAIPQQKVIIGSARRDENEKYSGGKPGDQDGVEVSTQNYYLHSKGWYLYRPINSEHAKKLAQSMYDACTNDNIGYCQAHREIMMMLKKYGSMKAIAETSETDCSNLVRGCIYEATGKDVGNFNTSTEPSSLEKSGLFEGRASVTENTRFAPGDILVTKTKGHTVIVISADGVTLSTSTAASTTSAKVESAKSKDASIAGKYKTTSNLNLRNGAGKEKKSIAVMPKGSVVQCYGYYTNCGDTHWYYVVYGERTGFCSSQYLEKC